jgi:hypothetical protein
MANITVDCVGTPLDIRLLCMAYILFILNRLPFAMLNGQTATYVCFGTTPDISNGISFPNLREMSGCSVGIAENFGDALIFFLC